MLLDLQTFDEMDARSVTHLRLWARDEQDANAVGTAPTIMALTHPATLERPDETPVTEPSQPVSLLGRVVGPYRLVEELQVGLIHSVYRGESLVDGSQVAVKVLRQISSKSSAARRLRQEWEFIQALQHEHVVKARDFFVGDGELFLVLEYLRGPNLDQYVGSRGPLDYLTAAQLLLQAASGLAHAHTQGLTHRDIKPANFCFDDEGRLRVIDFGISVDHAAVASLTLEHADKLIGTVNYMAPEQATEAHQADERSDVYALGCTFYFLLTGHPPFDRGSAVARLLMHRFEQPESIYRFRPDAPQELVALCEQMMAKAPDDRVQTMADVQGILASWLAQQQPT